MLKKLLLFFILFAASSIAQQIHQCKQRFDQFLNFHGALNKTVSFQQDVIYINGAGGKRSLAFYEDEIMALSHFFQSAGLQQQERLINLKGLKHFGKKQLDSLQSLNHSVQIQYNPQNSQPLKGIKIALDAGHFGTTLADAKVEQKYLYFAKEEGSFDSIKIFESVLTFNTAAILKVMLEEKGATVMTTRSAANLTSFNCSYNEFFQNHRKRVLDSLKGTSQLNNARYSALLKADAYHFFWDFFRDFDLSNRAKKINEFAPNLTLIIHYNVDEKNAPWTHLSDKNFTMAFIGGAFTADNLNKTESKLNFIRLLLTNQLNQSQRLAQQTVLQFNTALNIQIAKSEDADYLKNNCLSTSSSGVFCRNLALCRKINSPLVYGESLYQDNLLEAEQLMKLNIDVYGIQTNKRVQTVAKAYFDGLMTFLAAQN